MDETNGKSNTTLHSLNSVKNATSVGIQRFPSIESTRLVKTRAQTNVPTMERRESVAKMALNTLTSILYGYLLKLKKFNN